MHRKLVDSESSISNNYLLIFGYVISMVYALFYYMRITEPDDLTIKILACVSRGLLSLMLAYIIYYVSSRIRVLGSELPDKTLVIVAISLECLVGLSDSIMLFSYSSTPENGISFLRLGGSILGLIWVVVIIKLGKQIKNSGYAVGFGKALMALPVILIVVLSIAVSVGLLASYMLSGSFDGAPRLSAKMSFFIVIGYWNVFNGFYRFTRKYSVAYSSTVTPSTNIRQNDLKYGHASGISLKSGTWFKWACCIVVLLGLLIYLGLRSNKKVVDEVKYETPEYENITKHENRQDKVNDATDESEIRSLLTLVADKEAVRNGSSRLQEYHIGNDYNNFVSNNITRGSRLLSAAGKIRWGYLKVKCMLTENGELHGRYHNIDHNVKLDFNGYIKPDGDLYIRLGHGSEQSEWRLHPVTSYDGSFRYEGTWGKKELPSYLVFNEE